MQCHRNLEFEQGIYAGHVLKWLMHLITITRTFRVCTSWIRQTDETYYSSVPYEIHFYALWILRTMSKGNASFRDTGELNPPTSKYIQSLSFCFWISVHRTEELQYVEVMNVLAIVIVSPWRLGSFVTAGFPVITRLGWLIEGMKMNICR